MADLNTKQIKLINDLAILGTTKTNIASTVHCSVRTVYNKLEDLFPRDNSPGEIKIRKRKLGGYKSNAQIQSNILEYVLNHPFCSNIQIIHDLNLDVKSRATVSNWLKKLGIGSYKACVKPAITPVNRQKRLELDINEYLIFQAKRINF